MSSYIAPTNLREYNERWRLNHRMWGGGLGNVWQSFPCYFCAAPDFVEFELFQIKTVLAEAHTCAACGRSAKTVFTSPEDATVFEIVQTGGDDLPDWLPIKVRKE